MQLEKPSLIKNVRFGFVLDNLETRLSLSDSRTKIKFKVGLDENSLVEIQPKNSFLDPDKMSFVFEGEIFSRFYNSHPHFGSEDDTLKMHLDHESIIFRQKWIGSCSS